MRNILIGNSSTNRAGKYLYYGAYDTDNINSLGAGELGLFWVRKSAGPDADTGVYTAGGSNDDAGSLAGANIDIADTLTAVSERDAFMIVQGTSSQPRLGQVICVKNMSFKVQEYVVPVKKVQTITIAAASLVATKEIAFRVIASTQQGEYAGDKECIIDRLLVSGETATTIGAALKAAIEAHPVYAKYIYSVAEAHSSDVVITITWKANQEGTIKSDSWATATQTIATSTASTEGIGNGAKVVALEKEIAVLEGYNPADASPNDLYSFGFSAVAASNYHQIIISHIDGDVDPLNTRQYTKKEQIIAIDTTDTDVNLLEELTSILTDMVSKRALNPAA